MQQRVLDVACDEAGYTGVDLLNRDQRIFAFSSVAIGDEEAFDIIQRARASHPVAMPELKASRLLKTDRGRSLIADILVALEGRYTICIHDKLLALCALFFEYIYEPVYREDPRLLYAKNLHRFVASYAYLWLTDNQSGARDAIEQFQRYMRSLDSADAPFLFNRPQSPLTDEGKEHPFETVLHFAYGYKDQIIADNARLKSTLPDKGKWILELSTSSLWSQLNYWGTKQLPLRVRCDASKPLQQFGQHFTGNKNDLGIERARMMGHRNLSGWTLAEPIAFCNSFDHPSIQLADIVAGTGVAFAAGSLPEGSQTVIKSIMAHGHPHSIWFDFDTINPKNRSAAVNALILYDLAKRAERQADPYENLDLMYRIAEVEWVKGNTPFNQS
jgi:hypothetical protein